MVLHVACFKVRQELFIRIKLITHTLAYTSVCTHIVRNILYRQYDTL